MDFPFFVDPPPTVAASLEEEKSKALQQPSDSQLATSTTTLLDDGEADDVRVCDFPTSTIITTSQAPPLSPTGPSCNSVQTVSNLSYFSKLCSFVPDSPQLRMQSGQLSRSGLGSQQSLLSSVSDTSVGRRNGKFKSNRIVAFVNKASGDRKGDTMLKLLRLRLCGPNVQIYDVAETNMRAVLEEIKQQQEASGKRPRERLLVLACGGDGTVYSAIQAIFESKLRPIPKLGIVPIGTGNDTSRELGWGKAFDPTPQSVDDILWKIRMADARPVDIWKVSIYPLVRTPQGLKDIADPPVPEQVIYSANYFNIGLDASCSLRFDEGRKEHPKLFKSRVGKTLWYMLYGLKSFGRLHSWNLTQSIQEITVDGKPMVLPKEAKTLIFLNFRSYQNGVDIWWDEDLRKEQEEEEESQSEGEESDEEEPGRVRRLARRIQQRVKLHREKDDEEGSEKDEGEMELQAKVWNPEAGAETVVPQSFCDRAIEIAMLEGMMHEAVVRSGLNRAKRLGQGQRIVVTTSEGGVPVAVDGEAQRLLSPSRLVIEPAGQLPILAPPPEDTIPPTPSSSK